MVERDSISAETASRSARGHPGNLDQGEGSLAACSSLCQQRSREDIVVTSPAPPYRPRSVLQPPLDLDSVIRMPAGSKIKSIRTSPSRALRPTIAPGGLSVQAGVGEYLDRPRRRA